MFHLITLLANNAAEEFENDLKVLKPALTPDNFPIFDVLFLGIGPDGHTCSLFPDHPLLNVFFKFNFLNTNIHVINFLISWKVM